LKFGQDYDEEDSIMKRGGTAASARSALNSVRVHSHITAFYDVVNVQSCRRAGAGKKWLARLWVDDSSATGHVPVNCLPVISTCTVTLLFEPAIPLTVNRSANPTGFPSGIIAPRLPTANVFFAVCADNPCAARNQSNPMKVAYAL